MSADAENRESLARYLERLREQVRAKPYAYWERQKYPLTYEEEFEGRPTQVEIDALDIFPEFIHLLITASNSRFGWYDRDSADVFVRSDVGE